MTDQKIYAGNFRCTFDDPGDFIQFLKERKENSRWMTAPSRNLVFESLEKNTQMGELYLKLYDHDGRAEIIADTMENTSLLLKVNGETYPVRSLCDQVDFGTGPHFRARPEQGIQVDLHTDPELLHGCDLRGQSHQGGG